MFLPVLIQLFQQTCPLLLSSSTKSFDKTMSPHAALDSPSLDADSTCYRWRDWRGVRVRFTEQKNGHCSHQWRPSRPWLWGVCTSRPWAPARWTHCSWTATKILVTANVSHTYHIAANAILGRGLFELIWYLVHECNVILPSHLT